MVYSILIVEDETDVRDMIEEALTQPEYKIYTAGDGQEALEFIRRNDFIDLVILDLMLPKVNGMTVLKKVREQYTIPILILSVKDGESDKVLGLEYGADDYITKPFSIMELQARVKAFLRRTSIYHTNTKNLESRITIGDLTIETEDLVVKKKGVPISLTAKEFEVLKLFAGHPEKVYTKVSIYQEVWDEEFLHDDNVINVTIRRLREKIEDQPSDPRYIKTVWGIGYKLGTAAEGGL